MKRVLLTGAGGFVGHHTLENYFSILKRGIDGVYPLDGELMQTIGWTPPIPLEASLKKTIEWTLQHQQWLLPDRIAA